jgi:hypothetical protein
MKTLILALLLAVPCFSAFTFSVNLTFSNVTNAPISFLIVKGDLYEATDQGSFVQNAVATEDKYVTIPARATITVQLAMACIDPDRPAPEPDHQIRPTAFTVPGRPDPDQVHQRLRDAASRYRR